MEDWGDDWDRLKQWSGYKPGDGFVLGSAYLVIFLTLLASLFLSPSLAFPEDKPEKARLELRVMPYAVVGPPAIFRANVKVLDPRQEMQCPTISFEWGDGCLSSQMSDCEPYGLQEDQPTVYSVTRDHKFYFSGEFDIKVTTKSNGKTLSATRTILIGGGRED